MTEELKLWMKVLPGNYKKEPLRSLFGKFYKWSGATIGESMTFMGQGFEYGTRLINTSPVKSIREIEEDN